MSDRTPITPTRIIPAGKPLPAPAPAGPPKPPPPPRPPAPPAVPDPLPDWWGRPPGLTGPPPPPPPVPVDVHVTVTIDHGPLVPIAPEPGPRWYRRFRIGYNAACAAAGFMICGPWAWTLASIRTDSLAGAWVAAIIPGAVIYLIDNARQVEADYADERLIAPRLRAAITRTLLWAEAAAVALSLPITTLVYLITGVQP